jgi:hypothetical protein
MCGLPREEFDPKSEAFLLKAPRFEERVNDTRRTWSTK